MKILKQIVYPKDFGVKIKGFFVTFFIDVMLSDTKGYYSKKWFLFLLWTSFYFKVSHFRHACPYMYQVHWVRNTVFELCPKRAPNKLMTYHLTSSSWLVRSQMDQTKLNLWSNLCLFNLTGCVLLRLCAS